MNNSLFNYFWNALIFLSLLSAQVLVAQSPSDFVYHSSTTAIAITGYVGPGGDVVIPSTLPRTSHPYDPLPVTDIRYEAFEGISTITSVTIPTSVTTIEVEAFRDCTGIISVDLGTGVSSLGDNAFRGCTNLRNITIPSTISTFGQHTFSNCSSLEEAIVDVNLALGTFAACVSLNRVTINEGVEVIEPYAFASCSGLTNVVLPDSLTTIGFDSFQNCHRLRSIAVPNGVTNIGSSAFIFCYTLSDLTIGSNVTTIGSAAFNFCTSLTTATLPASVTTIGDSPFGYCTSLQSIEVAPGNTAYMSDDGILFDAARETLVQFPAGKGKNYVADYVIPNTVTSVGVSAFSRCSGITGIVFPDGLTTIERNAFRDCSGLSYVQFGSGLEVIDQNAFNSCSSLDRVNFPNSLTTIDSSAFDRCSSLGSVTFGLNLTTIRSSAFYRCSLLSSALFKGDAPISFGGGVFSFTDSTFKIYYFEGAAGFTSPTWQGYPAVMLTPIGAVAVGSATLTRDGVTSVLQDGDPIVEGDILETDAEESISLLFVDETSLEVGPNARLVIDEYVYDSGVPEQNKSRFSMLRGIFLYTSGIIGREDPDDVWIETGVGSIGIRGTKFTTRIETDAELVYITLSVTTGVVVWENYLTGETQQVNEGESVDLTAPVPSLNTIGFRIESGDQTALNLWGYTDAPFTVQRSTNLYDWNDWVELDPADLPIELSLIPADPTDEMEFFRLTR